MASIAFTDATGSATLTNAWASTPADRFASWVPRSLVVGPKVALLGSGARRAWAFRTDYGATFALTDIPHTSMSVMERLTRHLDGGGTVTVTTHDSLASTYATCCLAPDADPPVPELSDAQQLFYTVTFSLINIAATPAPMLCRY